MKTTSCTPLARKKAKNLIAMFRQEKIQIWKHGNGFQVMTFERPNHSYGSSEFASKLDAFCHIVKRAANTGIDTELFNNIAIRYFRRFLA